MESHRVGMTGLTKHTHVLMKGVSGCHAETVLETMGHHDSNQAALYVHVAQSRRKSGNRVMVMPKERRESGSMS